MDRDELKPYLDRLVATYDRRFLATDPLAFVHRYSHPEDQELVGLLASSLAFGNVPAIAGSLTRVLDRLGERPASTLDRLTAEDLLGRLGGFRHRWISERDLAALLWAGREMRRRSGSIGAFFGQGHHRTAGSMREGLVAFVEQVRSFDYSPFYRRSSRGGRGLRFLLPSPEGGSGCKRLNLYLRWMVRPPDGLDLGLWTFAHPRQLLVPVDTHVARIASYIGLTHRRTRGWRMTEEITAALRRLDPDDPVRYDFALCRLGILDACPKRRDPVKCAACPLLPVCRL